MFAKLLGLALVCVLVGVVVTRQSAGGGPERLYVVRPYDTLWAIASAHSVGDPREAVWRLERRNHLAGPLITAGERLVLPP